MVVLSHRLFISLNIPNIIFRRDIHIANSFRWDIPIANSFRRDIPIADICRHFVAIYPLRGVMYS